MESDRVEEELTEEQWDRRHCEAVSNLRLQHAQTMAAMAGFDDHGLHRKEVTAADLNHKSVPSVIVIDEEGIARAKEQLCDVLVNGRIDLESLGVPEQIRDNDEWADDGGGAAHSPEAVAAMMLEWIGLQFCSLLLSLGWLKVWLELWAAICVRQGCHKADDGWLVGEVVQLRSGRKKAAPPVAPPRKGRQTAAKPDLIVEDQMETGNASKLEADDENSFRESQEICDEKEDGELDRKLQSDYGETDRTDFFLDREKSEEMQKKS
nr:hypothetical protein Iba_chr13bCG16300 [Ipomoea batatas]